jgi:hypothetical protein
MPKVEKQPAILSAKPLKAGPSDDELQKLLIDRYNAAISELEDRYNEFLAGHATLDLMEGVVRRVASSGVELKKKPEDRIALREQLLDFMKRMEEIQKARFDAARIPQADVQRARYFRLDAEIQLLKEKRKAHPVNTK